MFLVGPILEREDPGTTLVVYHLSVVHSIISSTAPVNCGAIRESTREER